MDATLRAAALLTTAGLFGGMALFAGGFAAFLFTVLPVDQARTLIRRAFPPFYLFVIVAAGLASALAAWVNPLAALLLAAVSLSTVPTRQWLMPAINRATDAGQRRRFAQLHGLSVLITLAHIVAAAWALVRLAG